MKQKSKDISKESKLENFLIDRSNEKGKLYIDIYESYAEAENRSLNEIIEKINEDKTNYDSFDCQQINIKEAQRGDL